MIKIRIKKRNYEMRVSACVSLFKRVDEVQLNHFSQKGMEGFLKPVTIKKRKVEYLGPIGISLLERLQKTISKYDFFFLIEQVIVIIQRTIQGGMNIGDLLLNVEQVFINEVTKEIRFVYLPVRDVFNTPDILKFMESIIYLAKPSQEEDMEYISRFAFFLKSLNGFEPEQIEKFISREEEGAVRAVKSGVSQRREMLADISNHRYSVEEIEEETGLLIDDEETGLLLNEETGLLSANVSVAYANLYRIATQETIVISKQVFRLGKDSGNSDYNVSGNDSVSRKHAEIIVKGNRYFVTDLNSRNRTYINGEVIPFKEEIEIIDGDVLKLANEEFIFRT